MNVTVACSKRSTWAGSCVRLIAAATALFVLAACGALPDRAKYAREDLVHAEVPGFPGVRLWADASAAHIARMNEVRTEQERRAGKFSGERPSPVHFLALSGGAADGAFGAGLLNGWTEHGSRPQFDIVTGVSTGSLIAPLAFLGSVADAKLKEAYTTVSGKSVIVLRDVFEFLFGVESVGSSEPLRRLVAKYADAELLRAVATEHAKGRRLFAVTTQLDAQRAALWDLGAIATVGTPQALDLFQTILVASASVPGAFPPVFFETEADGRKVSEMHVDGGVTSNIMSIPLAAEVSAMNVGVRRRERHMHVVINGRMGPEFEVVQRGLLKISGRAVATLIKVQTEKSVADIYRLTRAMGGSFHLAYIGEDFAPRPKEPFDQDYMIKLYEYGRALGRAGYPWKNEPPGMVR